VADRVNVGVEGWRELRKQLSLDHILGGDWKQGLESAAKEVERRLKISVPSDTGEAKGSIKTALQNKPVPMWAAVRMSAKTKRVRKPGSRGSPNPTKSFRVMGALEGGGMYHYRGTGQRTKGYWSGALSGSKQKVDSLVQGAAKAAEARFSKWKGVVWLSKQVGK
jgi:hypothetical protein